MDRNSYLDPQSLYAQSEQALKKLINNNLWMERIKKCFEVVLEDEQLQGEAWNTVKTQIRDYLAIVDVVVFANEMDMKDVCTLANSVGDEVLDGNVIFSGMEQAAADKIAYEVSAENCEMKADNAMWFGEEWYYQLQASHYRDLANNAQELYNEWQLKAIQYDDIENNTKGLFTKSEYYREIIENAITGISKSFVAGEYLVNENATWRTALYQLSVPKKWPDGVQEALLEYGYTQEEINILKTNGVVITEEDIEKLKHTVGTTEIYVSEDHNALLYNGKIYYIDIPDTTDDSSKFEPVWTTDYRVEKTKADFDFLAALTGMEGEEIPTEEIYTADRNYQLQRAEAAYGTTQMDMAALGSIFLLGQSFFFSGANHTEVTMKFESAGNAGKLQY